MGTNELLVEAGVAGGARAGAAGAALVRALERRLRPAGVAPRAEDGSDYRQGLGAGRAFGRGGRGCRCRQCRQRNRHLHPAVRKVDRAAAIEWDPDEQEAVSAEGPHEDLFGHRTACAGISLRGAPDAALRSVRVLGRRLSGKGLVFAAGLRWAMAQGEWVVNLLLSTRREDYHELFHEIADEAAFAGVVLVCRANNVPAPRYPAQFSSVISVAAHEGTDPFCIDVNVGHPVDFGAPGIDPGVPWVDGGTIVLTGNSFAAPHVTGLVARMLSEHPHLTPYEVKTVLRAVASNAERKDGGCNDG